MEIKKKVLAMVLCGVMTLALGACGSTGGDSGCIFNR